MTKLCPRGKAAAKRKFKVYPSAYANAYASRICAGKIKDPSGVKRKDFRGSKAEGGLMEATSRLKRQGLKEGSKKKKDQGDILGARFDKKFKKLAESKETQLHAKDFDAGVNRAEKRAAREVMQEAGIPMARGGRAMLRGGGICKRGMNRQAIGKNS